MISMLGKTCPYCKERVKKDAGFAGLAAGTVLALVFGYWKERRRWQEDITDYSVSEEFDNEEF
ncbi:MAG: hypothetical protein JRF43_00840 [Deltaproteobacteria bacterium]|nr:hypothetical protein [Deltaproteobacteria bacterium]